MAKTASQKAKSLTAAATRMGLGYSYNGHLPAGIEYAFYLAAWGREPEWPGHLTEQFEDRFLETWTDLYNTTRGTSGKDLPGHLTLLVL